VSRHHILPPIVYVPAPPKPKKTERRRGVGSVQGKGATDGVDETEEASEVSVAVPARAAAPPLQNPSTPIESAERRIPSTTGNLSESTLKELLLAQEQEQQSTAVVGGAAPAVKP
jgi:hypothetical protein